MNFWWRNKAFYLVLSSIFCQDEMLGSSLGTSLVFSEEPFYYVLPFIFQTSFPYES
jgi:hypothetical protein